MRVWLQAIYLFCSSKKGISTRQLQRTFGCGLKTAWFLGHRVREAMRDLGIADTGPLGGSNQVVEADETYVGGKAANRKGKIPPKAIMLSLVERDGRVRSFHVPNVTAQTLKPIIIDAVHKSSYLMTDDSPVYPGIGREFAGHGSVNHSIEEYVRAEFLAHQHGRKLFLASSSAACSAATSTSARRIWRGTPPSSISDTTIAIALGVDDLARADRALGRRKGQAPRPMRRLVAEGQASRRSKARASNRRPQPDPRQLELPLVGGGKR